MSDFPSEASCLRASKHFVDEPFRAVFQKLSGSEKVYGKARRRGKYRSFPSKIFCLKVPKYFVGDPLVFL